MTWEISFIIPSVIMYTMRLLLDAIDGSFHPHPEKCEATFAEGMSNHIRNLGPHEWRVAHSHLTSTYLNESEKLLYQWRAAVEVQGCQLINTGNCS